MDDINKDVATAFLWKIVPAPVKVKSYPAKSVSVSLSTSLGRNPERRAGIHFNSVMMYLSLDVQPHLARDNRTVY